METKGKAVDSIIQYQLHKKSDDGDSGNISCNFEPIYVEPVTISEFYEVTQEMYDSDPLYSKLGVFVGETVSKITLNVSPKSFKDYLLNYYITATYYEYTENNVHYEGEAIYFYNNEYDPFVKHELEDTYYELFTPYPIIKEHLTLSISSTAVGAINEEDNFVFFDKLQSSDNP